MGTSLVPIFILRRLYYYFLIRNDAWSDDGLNRIIIDGVAA